MLANAPTYRREDGYILRDAIASGSGYADDVLMAMLESEWRARQAYSDTRC